MSVEDHSGCQEDYLPAFGATKAGGLLAFRVPGLLTTNMFKPAAATIDVGINEIIGDVETDDFANIPSWTTLYTA